MSRGAGPDGGWWQDERGNWRHGPRRAATSKTFLFGDPCRARSLGFALAASVGSYPLFWAVFFFLLFLGEPADTRHAERVIVVLAGVGPAIGLVITTVGWRVARHTYPAEERQPLRSREGALAAVGVLVI